MSTAKLITKIKSVVKVTSASGLIFSGFCLYKNDERFYSNSLKLSRKFFDPETIQRFMIFACNYGLIPVNNYKDTKILETNFCGISLKNPLGIAAGFDVNGEAIESLHKMGFGFVEIGSVLPDEQLGNPLPRAFWVEEDEAIINNNNSSKGHEFVVPKLRHLRRKLEYEGVIGVNMGKNKFGETVHDISMGVKVFSPTANYLVVNISKTNNLQEVLREVHKARLLFDEEKQRPIFLKLSPDLSEAELNETVKIARKKEFKINGFIISSDHQTEEGGLSGKPLKDRSTKMIEDVFKLTNGKATIIGSGGIFSGKDAYEKILAGASVVQIYTSFMYHGPPIVNRVKKELSEILLENGYQNVEQAIGKGVELKKTKFLFFW